MDQTIKYYDKHAKEWKKFVWNGDEKSDWESDTKTFNDYLPNGKIIEFGCGTGRDAKSLINLGYDYLGTDASKTFLKISAKRNPNGRFELKSLYDLDYPSKSFDGFWTAATLLHIPKNDIFAILKNISKIIKRNGIGFISLKAGASEKIDKPSGRLFAYYSLEEFMEILQKSGFIILESMTRKDKFGTWWLVYFVKNIA